MLSMSLLNRCARANQYVRASRREMLPGANTFAKKSTQALWPPKAGVNFLYSVISM